jgi:hypothetical protein
MSRKAVMTQGEEDVVFFFYIGRSIEAWATAENMLRSVMIACIPTGRDDITTHSVNVAFNSIDSFRAKMDFTEAIVHRRFPEVREDWKKLVTKTRSLSWQRNKIAHWRTALYDENMPGRRLMLVPWVIPKPKRRGNRPAPPPPGALALKDIWKLEYEFTVLAMRLENFAARLRGAPALHEESALQLPHPPTTAKLRDQILEEFRLRLSPSEP